MDDDSNLMSVFLQNYKIKKKNPKAPTWGIPQNAV